MLETTRGFWRFRGGAAVTCGLAAGLMLSAGQAFASPSVGQCDSKGGLPGNLQLQVTQEMGRSLIEISRPNSAGRKVEVEYGDELYTFKFGPDGTVRAGFALTAENNEFVMTMSETQPITCSLQVPEWSKLYRVVLRWRDPVQFDLTVVEPGGVAGQSGFVNASHPNSNLREGVGQMDVIGGAPTEGSTAEMSYVVPNRAAVPPGGVFAYKLDYVSRGQQPDPPYCDDGALAVPPFEFITIENGMVTRRKGTVNRAHCKEKIADSRRLMPIRQ